MITQHLSGALRRLDSRLGELVEEEKARATKLAGDGAGGWEGVKNLTKPSTEDLMSSRATEIARLVSYAPMSPLARLVRALNLDPIASDVMLILLAPYIEPRYQSIFALLQDDPQQRHVTERIVLAILGSTAERRVQIARIFAAGGLLRRAGVVRSAPTATDVEYSPLAHPYTLAPDVISVLLDDRYPILVGMSTQYWTQAESSHPPTVATCQVFQGPGGVIETANASLPDGAMVLNAQLDPESDAIAAIYAAWRVGISLDAWPVLDTRELGAERISLLARTASNLTRHFGGRLWLLASSPIQSPIKQTSCRPIDWSMRVSLWKTACSQVGVDLSDSDYKRLAGRHRLGSREISEVLLGSINNPNNDTRNIVDQLDSSARLYTATAPTSQRSHRPAQLDDLVLRDTTREALDRLVYFVDNRDRIAEEMPAGASRHFPLDTGPIALFHGRPGTGKTMAAEAVAQTLGRHLHVVDVSQLVSKYVGETEKHIDEALGLAERNGWVMLFDEADGLFTTRVENASSAGEQFSNMVVGYLLQRMEQHDGLIMLATNLAQSIDDAFMRRFLFRVEFPLPDHSERTLIWTVLLREKAADDLDLSSLGEEYRLSGGEIRNAAMKAVFLADNRAIPLDHTLVEEAVRLELYELGRLSRLVPSDDAAVDRGTQLRAVGTALRMRMEKHLRTLYLKEIHVLEGAPTEKRLAGRRPALSVALFRLAGKRNDENGLRIGAIISAWSTQAEEENEILGATHAFLSNLRTIDAAGNTVTLRMQETHDFDLLQRFWSSHEQPMKPSIVLDMEVD